MPKVNAREFLVDEVKRLKRNLKRRFANIEKKYGMSPALASWKKANLDLSIKGKSNKELQNLLSNLRYFESLKTSTIKGVEKYKTTFEYIELALETYSNEKGQNELKEKFFELYSKFVEENHLLSKYKYEVMSRISTLLVFGVDDETIKEVVEELYDELYAAEQGMPSNYKNTNISYDDISEFFK